MEKAYITIGLDLYRVSKKDLDEQQEKVCSNPARYEELHEEFLRFFINKYKPIRRINGTYNW